MAKKRAEYGQGSLTSLGRDRWRYRLPPSRGRKCFTFEAHGVVAARRERDRILAESGLVSPVTVGQAHDAWWVPWADLRCEQGTMSHGSRKVFDSSWRAHVAPRWDAVRLDDVRPSDIESWLLTKTPSVAQKCRVVLSRVMDRARFNGATTNDPFAAAIMMPTTGSERRRAGGSYDAAGLLDLWRRAWGTQIECAVLLCGMAGCRVGEALGVRCVETVCGACEGVPTLVAPIVRQSTDDGPKESLKNRHSARYAVLAGPMAERAHAIALARHRAGLEWLTGEGADAPMEPKTLRRRMASICGPDALPAQNLRPSWQTLARHTLMMAPADIEMMMGHSAPGVTGRHYERPHMADYVRPAAEAYAEHPWADDFETDCQNMEI